MVYYAYFHSIMHFGVIFWGNSSYAISIFRAQKRVLRIVTGTGYRNSFRQLFITSKFFRFSLNIFTLYCALWLITDSYQFTADIHSRNIRHCFKLNLYQPSAHLSLYQKGTYCMSIRVFNTLPLYIKQLYNNPKGFITALKGFLTSHSFYTSEEYFNYSKNKDYVTWK
jgi:hypothetical protein